jgi:endonuclease G, mitochondrial
MNRAERIARLKRMLEQVAPEQNLESLASVRRERADRDHQEGLESMSQAAPPAPAQAKADNGLRKLLDNKEDRLDDEELFGLEAIVMVQNRPVVFVRNGSFDRVGDPWLHLNSDPIRSKIVDRLPLVGRLELPNSPSIPYGGTAFVVGPNLLMTNRHVAKLFSEGVGQRNLVYRPGDAAVNFRREFGQADDSADARASAVQVREVVMIHPYWDMSLIKVDGLPRTHSTFQLSVRHPEELEKLEIATIGYPARDDRNDLQVQDRIFQSTYYVKRLQPGQLRAREEIQSFSNTVNALTHDSSTLGGNSGSAILDIRTGELVGLHFAGVYLKANYAVPAYELARDRRVVAAGVVFTGRLPTDNDWEPAWRGLELVEKLGDAPPMPPPSPPPATTDQATPVVPTDGQVTWTIPIQVSVSLGQAELAAAMAAAGSLASVTVVEAPRRRIPIIYDDLESRKGYQADFLELAGKTLPLPELTAQGRKAAAAVEGGTHELKYHKFSVVMHKGRRMALFTAANVDWRRASREVNGHQPTRKELNGLLEGTPEQWVTDPRIAASEQLSDSFFANDGDAFDKGHIVRREDVCWGSSFQDIQKANGDTFHTTNCTPQVAGFNRSTLGTDNWGDIEALVQSQTKAEKAVVFGGPVLAPDDPIVVGRDEGGPVRVHVPRAFWKIIVVKGNSGPEAFGFVLAQNLSDVAVEEEFAVPPRWRRFLKPIDEIEGLLRGLVKLTKLKGLDQRGTQEGVRVAERLAAP